jgi:pimeloyl-ACP methyl ester carboxylesterase
MPSRSQPAPAPPPPLILNLRGSRVVDKQEEEPIGEGDYVITSRYDLGGSSRGTAYAHEEEIGQEVVGINAGEDIEWYGPAHDLPAVTGTRTSRGRDGQPVFTLPRTLNGASGSRGFLKDLVINTFSRIKRRKQQPLDQNVIQDIVGESSLDKVRDTLIGAAGEYVGLRMARRIDGNRCARPGLHRVDHAGQLSDIAGGIATDRPILIFVHGTISNFSGGFGGIEPTAWAAIYAAYGGEVYAFNHPTITESPVRNALDLLAALPTGCQLDLVTHSRGGLIGDVLARCDLRLRDQLGYTTEEIDTVRSDEQAARKSWETDRSLYADTEADRELEEGLVAAARRLVSIGRATATLVGDLEEVNKVAPDKRLTVRRIVRVAAPAAGTTLLAERLDHLVNALLNLAKYAAGPGWSTVIDSLRTFAIAVIEERHDPAAFPGLYAMVPSRGFARINNQNLTLDLPSELINVAGNSEVGGGPLQSLKVILSNLYYWQANDFVVDTASMSRGLFRRKVNTTLTITSQRIDHFSYFDEPTFMDLVTDLLLRGKPDGDALKEGISFVDTPYDRTDKGVLVDKFYDPGVLLPEKVAGAAPIVVLLPGIMGSHLSVGGDLKWIRPAALIDGALVDDLGEGAKVEAVGAVADYYQALSDYLDREGFEVRLVPYDWRISIEESAKLLGEELDELAGKGHSISIIAHSMGGLVMRDWIFKYPDKWRKLREERGGRTIFLGTPWRGSHLITELLTGRSPRLRQLHLLDRKHSKRELLEALGRHKGIFELLPLDDDRLVDAGEWEALTKVVGPRGMASIDSGMIDHLVEWRQTVADGLASLHTEDYAAMYYVAGRADETVDDYAVTYAWYRWRGRLELTTTPRGDGSVSWKRGIPDRIEADRRYFVNVEHSQLANDPSLFSGLVDLLRTGTTRQSAFRTTAAGTRGQRDPELAGAPPRRIAPAITDQSSLAILMGEAPAAPERAGRTKLPLRVEVLNGDLRWAYFPVLVGHFDHDGIVSAEKAIDNYLNHTLSERHQLGFYPGKIGEQEVIIHPESQPIGTVVVGLGDKEDLTGFLLAKTVEKGMLKYAITLRDNEMRHAHLPEDGHGVSVLFIGSYYGQMPLRESIRSILLGVRQANEIIASFPESGTNGRLRPITTVEFVDYYEDRAYEAYKSLQDLRDLRVIDGLELAPAIQSGLGKRRRFIRDGSRSWWQTFTTRLVRIQDPQRKTLREKLAFSTYNRSSSVTTDEVDANLQLARFMAEELSGDPVWNRENSKVLFEMLLPNRYKDFIRNHRNVSWRMDLESAIFPWEMFHDPDIGEEPTFVRSGMVRQLYSDTAEVRPALVRQPTALVVANPPFTSEDLPDLPGAEREGQEVNQRLIAEGFTVTAEIDSGPVPIIKALFREGYKIMHFASHGRFDPTGDRHGIAIGSNQFISPGTLRQVSDIPELVFVNCCYLGRLSPQDERYYRHRHRLAANIGTQLIESGVKAVIVAGWAVDDAAALTFATTFYDNLLEGQYFGESVLRARRTCWEQHQSSNTWGAYQCYGDPFYRATLTGGADKGERDLSLEEEIVLELDNLISAAESVTGKARREAARLKASVQSLLQRAEAHGFRSPRIMEREARFYMYINDYAAAVQRYEALFARDHGEYRVRSYHHYLYIRIRREATDPALDRQASARAIRASIRQIQDIRISEPGSTINTLLASAHKRLATKLSLKSARTHLRKSANYYLAAAREIGLTDRKAIYHVSSYISLAALADLGLDTAYFDLSADLGFAPAEYFKRWRPRHTHRERGSTYAQLRGSNLDLSELVYRGCTKQVDGTDEWAGQSFRERARALEGCYRRQFYEGYNLRDLYGQLEHLHILIDICGKLGKRALPELSEELKRMKCLLETYV